jgi:hypothetical protein
MPHFNHAGEQEWVCQKSGHICTGPSTWVERGSELAKQLGCTGNVCPRCLGNDETLSLHEHCRRESGLTGPALDRYINRHYGLA